MQSHYHRNTIESHQLVWKISASFRASCKHFPYLGPLLLRQKRFWHHKL